jgi:hypothetical protein
MLFLLQIVLPKIWSIIPELPEVEPVIAWKAHIAKTPQMTALPTYPLSKAPGPNAPIESTGPALENPAEPVVPAQPGNASSINPVEAVILANSSTIPNEQDVRGRAKRTTRLQTEEEITLIIAAPPVFLARMARAKSRKQLQEISQHHTHDKSFDLLPSMFGQPQILTDASKADFSFPGLPYLLDIKFDETSSGIRGNPNKEEQHNAVSETRLKWAERTVRSLIQHWTNPPAGALYKSMCQDLVSYSMDRHNQEIAIEVQASRSYLHVIQLQAIKQNFTFDLRVRQSMEICLTGRLSKAGHPLLSNLARAGS